MKAKRIIALLVLVFMMALPALVYASSYTSYLSFDTNRTGETRYYNGNDMSISMTASSPCQGYNVPQIFTVKLYRDNSWLLGDDYIGSSTFNRNGFNSATWSSVGSGDYYFSFSKAFDGYWVSSNDVYMHN